MNQENAYDQQVPECEILRAEVSRLTAELAESHAERNAFQDQCIRLKIEASLLRAQEPVEIHQWRRTNGDGRWRDATKEEAYSRIDEHYEARTLYARPVPAAQAVPDAIRLDCARHMAREYDCGRVDGWNQCREAMLAAATQPPASDDALLFAAEAKLAAERKS